MKYQHLQLLIPTSYDFNISQLDSCKNKMGTSNDHDDRIISNPHVVRAEANEMRSRRYNVREISSIVEMCFVLKWNLLEGMMGSVCEDFMPAILRP